MDRLTSRKFLFAVLIVILAILGWASGNLTYNDMIQTAVWVAGFFMGAEGIADAAGRLASKPPAPAPSAEATVNVEAGHP